MIPRSGQRFLGKLMLEPIPWSGITPQGEIIAHSRATMAHARKPACSPPPRRGAGAAASRPVQGHPRPWAEALRARGPRRCERRRSSPLRACHHRAARAVSPRSASGSSRTAYLRGSLPGPGDLQASLVPLIVHAARQIERFRTEPAIIDLAVIAGGLDDLADPILVEAERLAVIAADAEQAAHEGVRRIRGHVVDI